MTTQIKYLAFKGIEKKEQILFKSFLNLAKNELEYQVVILKSGHADDPDILILDESYSFDDSEKAFQTRPTILIGDDLKNDSDTYICRPVQWSDFKLALSQLNVEVVDDYIGEIDTDADPDTDVSASTDDNVSLTTDASSNPEEVEQVLPTEVEFKIDHDIDSISEGESDSADADPKAYEYDLGDMSVEYNSFTNSDYMLEVADDVRGFNDDEIKPAVLLRTDDESSSVSSVLIFETDSREVWDISLSEETSESELDPISQIIGTDDDEDTEEVVLEQKVGLQIKTDEEYWMSDNEIIVDHQTLFYIKAERGMVYSTKEPGLWPQVLREGTISKLPMVGNWQPKKGLKAYSLSCIHWVNAIANEVEDLAPELDEKSAYILKKWPQFDLIELDNSLLKLCTMLFVRAETIESLMAKSGYSRGTIVGLINACHSINILRAANDFDQDNSISLVKTDGVLGKIKGVFK